MQMSPIMPGGYATVGAAAFSGAVTHTISISGTHQNSFFPINFLYLRERSSKNKEYLLVMLQNSKLYKKRVTHLKNIELA